ncbi:MAG: hypothetical protein AAF329_16985 [Cyanobacteria bacterium P01_A01_bin.17]
MVRQLSRSALGVAIATCLSPTIIATSAFANPASSFSSAEIEAYRAQGQAGLEKFLATHTPNIQELPQPELRAALDALCKQRDCHASRLFWYTDLTAAKAEAVATGKPILSLRMLGNLDQELSCANSRFFRVALYPNAQVSQYLRDRYILHWESVRPVPQVTIDYGDGRKLQRTLTGNSIHYILNTQGQPIDALPGLYGPQAFLNHLKQAETLNQRMSQLEPRASTKELRILPLDPKNLLQNYHRSRLTATQNQWRSDLANIGIDKLPALAPLPLSTPSAIDAGRLAVGKSMVETPLLSSALGLAATADRNRTQLEEATNTAVWRKIADLHQDQSQLDQNSKMLMLSKNSAQWPQADAQFEATVKNFETAMALDTVRNEYLLRSQIHQWFLEEADTQTVEALNTKVYADLFLTPDSDPWLGLRSQSAYSAIEDDGLQQ